MSKSKDNPAKILITMGDPLGIGPEVICKALASLHQKTQHSFHIVGCEKIFKNVPAYQKIQAAKNIHFIELENTPAKITSKNSGLVAYQALEKSMTVIHDFKALITAPVSKERIHHSGQNFLGHTEYLCEKTHTKNHAMMLFHTKLKVVLVTTHLALAAVAKNLSVENIVMKLQLTAHSLQKNFKIKTPKIAVCALNPHAGEGGLFGQEEETIILPAIKKFAKSALGKSVSVIGPLPSDTLFFQHLQKNFDAIICMYHDQGLIPLKMLDFAHGVNFTLGLPFVRTSPDHGTAFDIAGQNKADPSSMIAAIEAALKLSS